MNESCSLFLLIETLDICIDGKLVHSTTQPAHTLQQRPRQTEPTADSPELPHCSNTPAKQNLALQSH